MPRNYFNPAKFQKFRILLVGKKTGFEIYEYSTVMDQFFDNINRAAGRFLDIWIFFDRAVAVFQGYPDIF